MINPFREYAQYYDLLYRDKDYARETEFVVQLFGRWLAKPASQIEVLDLACGTGRHAQELARLGYRVEGSDISADMIAVAKEQANHLNLNIGYYNESFQTADRIDRKYDAVIIMFSAINYVTDYSDFSKTLGNIKSLLRDGGVLIFDFWNGNAVLNDFSPVRVKRAEGGGRSIMRISSTSLDKVVQIATVKFDFMLMQSGSVVREFSEVHSIRYFFPQEMLDLLKANGFEVIHRCPFLQQDALIEPNVWNLTYVARPDR
jgi:2-polyprenyl-3-methyl-5-hydroxy-6-metoxy-1,4-benzoquinol methylase